jgi:hypothetical protein
MKNAQEVRGRREDAPNGSIGFFLHTATSGDQENQTTYFGVNPSLGSNKTVDLQLIG